MNRCAQRRRCGQRVCALSRNRLPVGGPMQVWRRLETVAAELEAGGEVGAPLPPQLHPRCAKGARPISCTVNDEEAVRLMRSP